MKNYLSHTFDLQKLVEVFDELPLWSAPFGLKILEHIRYKKNSNALDIGCGAGFPITEIAMRLGPGSKVYGIDPWKDALERVKKKIEFYDIKNIQLIDGVGEQIPLSDESLDLITSNNGINNVSDMEKVFNECARLLKPGGQLLQTMNTDKSMIEFYEILEEILNELKLPDSIKAMKQHIYEKRKPVEEVIDLMKANGIQTKEIIEDKFSYQFADGTAMLNHYFIRLAFMDSWIKIIPVDRVDEIFTEVEQRMKLKANQDGDFKLTIPFVLMDSIRLPSL
jgi:arsenite methyltransferase